LIRQAPGNSAVLLLELFTKSFLTSFLCQLITTKNNISNMFTKVLIAATMALSSAVELTPDNWDSETSGKTVFIKFQAPW
tara:strand:+ start:1411 stop:1650 length:240 start_codon:yes stop_codon:yes gene_type:complete